MKESLLHNLEQMVTRHEEISGLLSDPEVIGDQNRFRTLSQEYARLEPVATLFNRFSQAQENLRVNRISHLVSVHRLRGACAYDA